MTRQAPTDGRELVALFQDPNLFVLVPRKRGAGFLRVPLGHHHCPLADLEARIGCDIIGLDGHLWIDVGYTLPYAGEAKRHEAAKAILQVLGAFYELPWREAWPAEFWRRHPIAGQRGVLR